MPRFKGITTHITDSRGQALPEWGVRHSSDEISCYIQSETDTIFRISLKPDANSLADGKAVQLLATFYIDGRENAEASKIVYLNSTHRYFNYQSAGKVFMDGRKLRDSHGNMCLHQWVFKELGIDIMLEDLSLAANGMEYDSKPEQEVLADKFRELGANGLEDKKEAARGGSIKLTFERIAVDDRATEKFDYIHGYEDDSQRGGKRSGKDISHHTERTGGQIIGKKNRCIDFQRLNDGIIATFTFFYQSEDVLRKFDFEGFPPKTMGQGALQISNNALFDIPVRSTKRIREDVIEPTREKKSKATIEPAKEKKAKAKKPKPVKMIAVVSASSLSDTSDADDEDE